MLVLAMEFSRGAQRAHRTTAIKEQTDDRVHLRTGERPTTFREEASASRRRDGIAPGCSKSRNRGSLPQNGIVMPDVNRSAHRPHERDIRRCAVRQGRDTSDSE